MSAETDDELMIRFQHRRDFAAFEQLFHRHKEVLLRFLVRLVRTRACAEDASQHTWLKVIEVARKGAYALGQGAAFRTWLFAMARNHVIDEHHRKLAATHTVLLSDSFDNEAWHCVPEVNGASPDPVAEVGRGELIERIQHALARLPFEQREVIALWVSGIDPMDIASMTNAPRETVLSRKKYAIAKLRKSLHDVLASERQHD